MSKFQVVISQPPLSSIAYIHEFLSPKTEMYKITSFKNNKCINSPPKHLFMCSSKKFIAPSAK